MAHSYPKAIKVKGKYGPTAQNHYYQPAGYHNRSANHGYPKDDKGISRDLVNTWMETNVISRITQVRLLRVAQ